jgi:predicted RNase H-like HicB family nuclease
VSHYVAIIEEAGPKVAVGIWFPDLPGCFSAGDSLEEALLNARDAIGGYAEALRSEGVPRPPPRLLSALRDDPEWRDDIANHMIALVEAPVTAAAA